MNDENSRENLQKCYLELRKVNKHRVGNQLSSQPDVVKDGLKKPAQVLWAVFSKRENVVDESYDYDHTLLSKVLQPLLCMVVIASRFNVLYQVKNITPING